ncbi:hypothetical protein DJ013_14285 [Arcticibacterium luteifluviistationis]|uniref:DUF3108 domain-containing protein n=1 Tax=Arcticibacterium luteifluviistationis TaxID=1784714 RepID=A0A2Z4GD88_9BACT|nr:hypothetical protein DJ013_14285 [Arcticibacterium luteifluviistationis]
MFFSINSFAQTREYAVKVVGLRVGTIYATKTNLGDSVSYELKSKVDVNFLVYKLKVDYHVHSILSGGKLKRSLVSVESNRGNFLTDTKKSKEGYDVKSVQHEDKVNKKIKGEINSTFASIYFNEPKAKDKVYAEYYADFINITKPSPEYYKGVLNDNVDEYYYKNGELIKLVKKNKITDMVIEYQEPSNKKVRK